MTDLYEYRLEVKDDLLKECRDRMHSITSSYTDPALNNFPLVISEIYTNLLQHSVPSPTWFNVELRVNLTHFDLLLSDNGGTFYKANEYIASLDEGMEDLKLSGMGLALIKRIFERVEYSNINESTANQWHLQLARDHRRKVAIVDDDESFLVLLQAYLEQDHDVLVFDQAEKALLQLQSETVDLVISDLNMPILNGIQLRKKLQLIQGVTPFIFITGEKNCCLDDLAIDAVLQKPVSKHSLQSCIQRVMSRHAQLKKAIGSQLSPAITDQLKPSITTSPVGFELEVLGRTCEAGGGDFLFQRKLSNGTLFVLGDVMGHDQQAKFFVHSYSGFIHGFCYGVNQIKPAELLHALSEALCDNELLASSLVTALALVLYDDGRIELASAGHPAPLVLKDNRWSTVCVEGTLPGLVPGQNYQSVEFKPDGPILCYTDGLQEALSDDSWTVLLNKTKRAMCEDDYSLSSVINYYDKEAGIPPKDDATLLTIKPVVSSTKAR